MKKKTSQADELNISNYFYAVYPLSIEFKEDYQKVLYLQFEKNLQIVLKFQLNKEPASKNQIISFDLPQKITHFRILSQKNLQYQWSLYCHERVNEERHEQFMQSQKINYKNYWTDYKSRQVDIHIIYVEFKKIKCKLEYLFVIANNSNQLLLKIKKHYALNLKPYPQRSNLSKQSQKPQSAMNAQFQSKLSNITGVEAEQKGRQVDSSPPLIFDHPNHDAQLLKQSSSEVQLQSLRLGMGRPLQQSIYQKQSNKQPNDKDLLTPQKSQQFLKLEEEKRYLKLSRSEIELSNKMMEDFEGLQSSVQKKTPKHQKSQSPQQFFALKHTGEQTLELPAIREPATQNLEARKQEADIKMTSSTLLNEKGQAIIPFYKNKAYIMIIIMVLLILGTALALFFMPKAKAQPDSINKPKERKTKGKERMQQQMGEGKGKREMKVKKQGVAQQVGKDVKQKKVQQKQRDVVKKMRSK